jgi:FkbM family methyltransferase
MIKSKKKKSASHYSNWFGAEEKLIRGLYLSLLDREPDAPGMQNWLSKIDSGMTLDEIAQSILQGAEYQKKKDHLHEKKMQIGDAYDELCKVIAKWAKKELHDDPLVIVDVSSQNLAYEKYLYRPLSDLHIPHRVIGFEPLEHGRRVQADEVGKLTFLPYFIRDGEVHNFYLNEPDNTSSLLPFNRKVMDKLVYLNQYTTVRIDTVSTRTLDSAMQDIKNIDFLKLDIQGLELPSLKNAISTLQRTEVIHCVVSFIEMYQGQALFSEVEQFLRTQGFDLVDIHAQHHAFEGTSFSSSKDLLGRADAIFFRRLNNLTSTRGIISQALLALTIYKKPSLAAWLANQIDIDGHPFTALFGESRLNM